MLINNIRKSPTCPIRNTIHAPTRGATNGGCKGLMQINISIHASTRGATLKPCPDTFFFAISIHAPTRGATAKMHNIPYASLQ